MINRKASAIAPHVCLPEPRLLFQPDSAMPSDTHPLRGLMRHGPFSSGNIPDPVRIATIGPGGESGRLKSFISELSFPHHPRERSDYLPTWPGFEKVFGVSLEMSGTACEIELDRSLEDLLHRANAPHAILAERLSRAIQRLMAVRSQFDVVVAYLPRRWAMGFKGNQDEDFDLHDHLKATTASLSMPIQLIREDKALTYECRASVAWHVGLALYAKVGGIPWKLSDSDPETAHVGISYAMRPQDSSGSRFVTCCSQVFDAEGAGMEFVAYDTHDFTIRQRNPFLSRTEMFRVMTRSMDLYRRRHAGRSPRKVVVHKTTEFKRDEVEGCMEALHLCESVDLLQIVQDVGWRGVNFDRQSMYPNSGPTAFPVSRGTLIGIGPRDALLWTHGNVRGISNHGRSFFKGSRSTPRPLRLVRHAGHGSWDETAHAILGLSKMNWNNDSLYDELPVTLSYARVLARVVKRMPDLRRTPYQFRFFM